MRSSVRTPNVNEGELRRTKYLVEKISGKYNIDRRYEAKEEEEEEAQAMTVPTIKEVKVNTYLDTYIDMLMKGAKNIDKFIYAVKDPGKDNPYDLEVVKPEFIKGGGDRSAIAEKKQQEARARQQTE